MGNLVCTGWWGVRWGECGGSDGSLLLQKKEAPIG